jgi:hypothetical protein
MDTSMVVVGLIVYILVCACAGSYVAAQKGRPLFEGLIFGLLFGPIGLVVEACLPDMGSVDDEEDIASEEDEPEIDITSLINRPRGEPEDGI